LNYQDQTIVVTGASRGIGRAFVEAFFDRGAKVICVSRQFPESYNDLFEGDPERIILLPADLGQPEERNRLIRTLLSDFDVSMLVNNAGVLTGDMLENLEPEAIEQCIQVNLIATMQLSRGLLPHFLKKNNGFILNNASVSAELYFPGAQVYAASKAGVLQFSKCLSLELKSTGVHCMALLTPGVRTQMYNDVEERYSSFIDLKSFDVIAPADWVQQVISALEKRKNLCYPKGKTRVGLLVQRYSPTLYRTIIGRNFKRSF